MARTIMKKKTSSAPAAPKETLLCDRCGVTMQDIEVQFKYLTRSFRYQVPRCPQCGQVSLPEELVNGRMAEVESMIEEK